MPRKRADEFCVCECPVKRLPYFQHACDHKHQHSAEMVVTSYGNKKDIEAYILRTRVEMKAADESKARL